MRRSGADWIYRDYVPPLAQTFYLRVRGAVASSGDSSGSGINLRVRQFHVARVNRIFADDIE